jgi:hypothetical protein
MREPREKADDAVIGPSHDPGIRSPVASASRGASALVTGEDRPCL